MSDLWLHASSGQWCKKFRGKVIYFGTDREEAERRFRAEWDAIKDGRPRFQAKESYLTCRELANQFLAAKRLRVDAGELTLTSWHEYKRTAEAIVKVLGRTRTVASLASSDFGKLRASAAERLGTSALGKFVILTRGIFGWGFEAGYIETPVRFGPEFVKPARRMERIARAERGAKLIEADDLRKLIEKSSPTPRAMILLGINCGFGGTDCAEALRPMLTVKPGWIVSHRQKTGVSRRCPLWPETEEALKLATKQRPRAASKADADCLFLTRTGQRFVRNTEKDGKLSTRNSVGEAYGKLKRACAVEHEGGFYTLRHTFRTVADNVADQVAIRIIMGHHDDSIDDTYRQRVDDARLVKVTDAVRAWLWV